MFYSNVGAPVAFELLKDQSAKLGKTLIKIDIESNRLKSKTSDPNVARRYEEIKDLFSA